MSSRSTPTLRLLSPLAETVVDEAEGAVVVAAAATAAEESPADAVVLEAPVAGVVLAVDAVALLVAAAGEAATLSTSMTTAHSPRLALDRANAHNTPGHTPEQKSAQHPGG